MNPFVQWVYDKQYNIIIIVCCCSGDVVSVSDIKLEPRVDHDTPSKLSVATTSGL